MARICSVIGVIAILAAVAHGAVITAITPAAGGINGQTRVTISGTGFDIRGRSNDVFIGTGLEGAFCDPVPNECTESRIVCLTDAFRGSGKLPLSVRSFGFLADCQITTGCGFEYTLDSTPEVSSIFPEWITAGDAQDTRVTVSGQRFSQGDPTVANFDFTMHLGDEERCELVGQVSASAFVCNVPPMIPGTLPVDIIMGASGRATMTGPKAVVLYPTINGVSPSSGSIAGGTLVTITGTSFSPELAENVVTVHGKPCVVTSTTSDRLLCRTSASNPTSTPARSWTAGKSRLEIWYDLPGTDLATNLIGKLQFHQPTEIREISGSGLDGLYCTNCAARMTTWFVAPATGEYAVSATGDDNFELWIGTDETPVKRKQAEPENSSNVLDITPFHPRRAASGTWNTPENATRYNLTQGMKYWLRGWVKQGTGGMGFTARIVGPDGANIPLAGSNISLSNNWVPPVSVTVRDMPAIYDEPCYAWGSCSFHYTTAATPFVTSVTPTATPGSLVTIAGQGFDTSATKPAVPGACVASTLCGGGGCNCPNNNECAQQAAMCSWNVTSGRCSHTVAPACDTWSMNRVTIGGAPCEVTSQTATELVCRLGYTAGAGSFPVSVLVANRGVAAGSPLMSVTATINGISPVAGSVNGGNSLTILGFGFDGEDGVSSVTVGPNNCPITSLVSYKIVCQLPAGTAGNATVVLSTKSRVASVAEYGYTYATTLQRPGTTTDGGLASVKPRVASLSGGTTLNIYVPSVDVKPTSRTWVWFGGVGCDVTFALGQTVTCRSRGVNSPRVAVGSIRVEHSDGTVQTSTLPTIQFLRSVTNVDNSVTSTIGSTLVTIDFDGYPVRSTDISVAAFGQPCLNLAVQSGNRVSCLVGPAPTVAPALPVIDSLTFTGDGNALTNPLNGMAYTASVRANADGSVTIPAGAQYLMTKRHYARPFVFKAQVMVSSELPRNGRVNMRVCVTENGMATSGYRGIVADTTDGRFAIGTPSGNSRTSTAQFATGTAFEAVGLDPTAFHDYRMEVHRRFVRFYIDNVLIRTVEDTSELAGSVGFGLNDQTIRVRNFIIQDLYPQSLQVNVSGQPISSQWDVIWGTGPTISSFAPRVVAPGIEITIAGTDFGKWPYDVYALATEGATITADTPRVCRGNLVWNSATSRYTFYCNAESIPAGTYFFTMQTGTGQAAYSVSAEYRAAVTSVSPTYAGEGGKIITLIGGGFKAPATVTVGGNPCNVKMVTHERIVCVAPPSSAGTASITVTTNGASATVCSACRLKYNITAPTVTAITPTSGGQGTVVTIDGTGFATNNGIVMAGDVSCGVWSRTDTRIRCTMGRSATTGAQPILVHFDEAGAATIGSGITSTFTFETSATSVSPSSGSVNGGTNIAIRGSNIDLGAGVTGFVAHTFTSMQTGWANAPSSLWTTCAAATSMLGPVYLEPVSRTFTSLPAHAGVRIVYNIVEVSANVRAIVDGVSFDIPATKCELSNMCGATWMSTCTAQGSFIVPHTSASLTLTLRNERSSGMFGVVSYAIETITTLQHTVTIGGNACPITLIEPSNIYCTTPAGSGNAAPVAVSAGGATLCSGCTFNFDAAQTPSVSQGAASQLSGLPANTTTVPQVAEIGVTATYSASGLSVRRQSNSGWNSGAWSPQSLAMLTNGPQGVSFTAVSVCHAMIGLSSQKGDTSGSYVNIDYAIYLRGDGYVQIYERGSYMAQVATFYRGDTFSVYYDPTSSTVFYAKNGVIVYASASAPIWPLYFASSVHDTNCGFDNAMYLAARQETTRVVFSGTGISASPSAQVTINGVACVDSYVTNGHASCWTDSATASSTAPLAVVVNSATGLGGTNSITLTQGASAASTTRGSANGGHVVTIAGTGFTAASTVAIGAPCTVKSWTATRIVCTTSANAAGSQPVVVTTGTTTHTCMGNMDVHAPTAVTTCAYTYDAASPAITTLTGTVTSGASIVVAGTDFRAGSTVQLSGTYVCQTTAFSATSITCTLPNIPAGAHSLNVIAPDFGAASNGQTVNPPLTFSSVSSTTTSDLGGATIVMTGSNIGTDTMGTVSVTVGGNALCSSITRAATTLTCVTNSGAFNGAISVTVNGATAQAAASFVAAPANAPTVTGVLPTSGGAGSTITVQGTNLGAGVAFVGGQECLIIDSSATWAVCTIQAGSAGGNQQVTVRTNDRGTGTGSATFFVRTMINRISPSRGPVVGGHNVTVFGSGFSTTTANLRVRIGGVTCAVIAATESAITCTAGVTTNDNNRTDVVVAVIDSASVTNTTSATNYNYNTNLTATLTAISPAAGSAAGMESITFTGTGFSTDATQNIVLIGGRKCPVTSVATDGTSLVCMTSTMPINANSSVDVVVNEQGRASNTNSLTFSSTLNINSVSGGSFSVEGGATVTFVGTGFWSISGPASWTHSYYKVSVGGLNCPILSTTPTQILCRLPGSKRPFVEMATLVERYPLKPEATNVTVALTANGVIGVVASSVVINYAHASTPRVTSVSPTGVIAPGASVTFTGTGFGTSGGEAYIGTVPCAVTSQSDTQVVCTASSSQFGPGFARVLVPSKGFSTAELACPTGQFLTCDGKCVTDANCKYLEWGMATCPQLTNLIIHDTFCHSNGGTDRVGIPFRTDDNTVFNLNCPMYSCEGGDCDTALYIGGRGGVVSTCGPDPSGHVVEVRPAVTALSTDRSSIGGGKLLTITGSFFGTNASDVVVRANAATCVVSSVTDTRIVCETTPQVRSVSQVQVYIRTTLASCSNCAFTYVDSGIPYVNSTNPVNPRFNQPLTIVGNSFGTDQASTVYIGSRLCPITSITDTQIVCTAPQNAAGILPIRVTAPAVGSSSGATVEYKLYVSGASFTTGSLIGGATVAIKGTGFSTDSVATFGSCPTKFVSITNGDLLVETTNCTGTQRINVNNGAVASRCDGACTNYVFDITKTPLISSLNVNSGAVTLGLSNLGSAAQADVTIMVGRSACSITSFSSSQITCTLGEHHPGRFALALTVAALGRARQAVETDPAPSVTYAASIASFTPNAGSRGGGQVVTISGSGFTSQSQYLRVNIGTTPCGISSSSATQIVCTTGQTETAGAVTVTVTSVDSWLLDAAPVVSSSSTYNYDNALTPTVTSIVPNRGSTAGGTSLTIGGTNLGTSLTVTIAGVVCTQSSAQQSQTAASAGSLLFCTTGAHATLLEAARIKVSTGANGDAYTTQTYHYIDLWSRWTTWGGSPPPIEGDSAVISEGQAVMVDYSPPRFFLVIVMGHLLFDPTTDIDFACTYIMINFGRFTVGTPEKPYLKKATITLHGDRLSPEIPVHGAKVIALRHGALDMHGEKRQPTWTKIAATAPAGAPTIQVRGPVDWRVGEFIVVASTDYEFHHTEHRMITGVTPADGQAAVVTLQLEYPLDFEHYGQRQCFGPNNDICVDEIAEVGLLTRNIVVKGDKNSMRLGFGGTMFLMPLGQDKDMYARLSYVEFAQCGQMFIVGRYPVHYHVTGTVSNSYVNGTSVHESMNRAFSIHGVHNNTYVNNVAYDIMGHAFFIEDGSERHNVIENNMVAVVKSTTSNLNTDVTPANFWIVSPTNIIRGNAACGGHAYGFWISPFHPHSTGPTHSDSDCPATHQVADFRDNVAHSNRKYGLNIFQFWWPKQVECDFNGPDAPAVLYNHVSYKNMIHGITMGNQEAGQVGSVIIDNYTAADNGMEHKDASAYWIEKNKAANQTIGIRNSRLIALTNNQPFRRSTARRAINLPEGDNFFSHNITFVNYNEENHGFEPQAWAERFSLCFPWGWDATSSGLTWINSPNRIRMRFHHHGVLHDVDGTLTDTPNTQIVAKSSIFDDTICTTVGPARYLRECLVCPASYKIRRFGISTMNEIWTWQKWMTDGRSELVPEILREYLMTAPINRSIGIDFQWWRTPRVWDWKFGAFIFLQPGERQQFWTIYNETKDHVYGTFNNKPLNRTWWKPEPQLFDKISDYSFNNNTMKYTGLLVYPESRAMTVESFNCPDAGCPLPPLPPPSWDKNCTSYHNVSSWASGRVPGYGSTLIIPSTDALCIGDGVVNGTCVPGKEYEYNYFSLRIEGSIQMRDEHCPCNGAVIRIVVQSNIWIRNGGILIGNATHPLTRCKFRISIQAPPFNDVTQMGNYKLNPWGFRSISVESGMLQLIGAVPRPLWARLSVSAGAGSPSITLDQAVDWPLGAKIAIASTHRNTMYTETVGIDPEWEQSEKRTIVAISADRRTLSFDRPLQYPHWGSAPQTIGNSTYNVGAEVIILDRNIIIDSGLPDDLSEPPFLAGWQLNIGCTPGNYEGCASGSGANVGWPMGIGKPGYLKIDGVQFKDIGQSALQHGSIEIDGLNDQVDAAQSVFRNNVVDRAFNMAIWIRDSTTNMNIVNNTFWNVSGDGIRVSGSGNNIDGNVFVRVNGPDQVCDKIYFKFWDCRQAGLRIHSGNRVWNNVVASLPGVGYLTDGDLCSTVGRWGNNYVHSARDGMIVADTPAEIFYNWALDSTVPTTCRRAGGVTAYWIGDQGFIAWYTPGDLHVYDLTVVEATVGSAAILMYPPPAVLGTYVPQATYTNIKMAGYWDGQSCRSAEHYWKCKKSLLDSEPWCSFFHLGHGQQHMGVTGVTETIFTSSEFGMKKTIGENKFRWLEMDSYATVAGQAHHTDVTFKNFDGSDRCGLKNVAFHQNPYSNDTFHHHTFRRVTWDSGVVNGGEFWARRMYGDTQHPADAFTPTYWLDFDNFKYGAYWPDSPNHILVHDLDGTFTRSGARTSIVASETITRESQFAAMRYHGRGFQNMPAARAGCTWNNAWSAYKCNNRFNWTSLIIDNLSEDRLTRRPGPVVLCKGDGMILPNGDPICQGGVVDYASGPVMKGKEQRATLERMTRYWFHAENGGNYTLSFRGQPPVWMRFYVADYEYLGVGNNVGMTLNLRYFGLNSANRVGVYVNGVRQRPVVGYGYPWEQTPAQTWPAPTDAAGTHYHDKYVNAQVQTSTGQGIQRNVLSFVVRAGSVVDLRQEPIVQVNANLAMPIDEFFNNKETFVAAMAATLGIDSSRLKFAEIVPGTTRRQSAGTTVKISIDQSTTAASNNFNSGARAGTESNDLTAIVASVNSVAQRSNPVPGYNVTSMSATLVAVTIPKPPLTVVYGTPFIGLNVSKGTETINTTIVRSLIAAYVLNTIGAAAGAPYNATIEDEIGVSNYYYDKTSGRTRLVLLMFYENSTMSKMGLEYLIDAFNSSASRNVMPGYTIHDFYFDLNGWRPEGAAQAPEEDLWATEGSVLKFAIGAAIGLVLVFAIGGALLYYCINVRAKKLDQQQKKAAGETNEHEPAGQNGSVVAEQP